MSKILLQIGSSLNCGAPGKIAEQIGLLKAKPLMQRHVENACLIISIRMTVLLIMWIYMIRLSYGHECLLLKQVI